MELRKIINRQRTRRRNVVSKNVRGTADRPRLSVHRSLAHISVQVIDDEAGRTLCSASTKDKALAGQFPYGGNCAAAQTLGKIIGERALAAGVKQVKFDRGSCKYHGRVAALATAAREAGLDF